MSTPKIFALMVAAGKGMRFGADVPKQYTKLLDKTVLEHSVLALKSPRMVDLTLVHACDDEYIAKLLPQLLVQYGQTIHLAHGGDERWQSVRNGVAAIRSRGADDNDWVLIHDAARPCLPDDDLARLLTCIEQADGEKVQGLILATPVVDTLKSVKDGLIERTVSREQLWCALTPQAFRLSELEVVLDYVDKQKLAITDEASAFEMMNKPVRIVPASRMNMKLTYKDDLPILALILQAKQG